MSDENKANTVEVPRELVDRLLAAAAYTSDQLVADLRACIKPRRWVFDRWAPLNTLDAGIFVPFDMNERPGFKLVRVTVEEIV